MQGGRCSRDQKYFHSSYAGVLSAYGMGGLADQRLIKEQYIGGAELSKELVDELKSVFSGLESEGRFSMLEQGGVHEDCINVIYRAHMRYAGSDTQLSVDFADSAESLRSGFEEAHKNASDL